MIEANVRKLFETMMETSVNNYSRKLKFDHSLKSQTKALIVLDQRQTHSERLFQANMKTIKAQKEEIKPKPTSPSAWFYSQKSERTFF